MKSLKDSLYTMNGIKEIKSQVDVYLHTFIKSKRHTK